MEVRILVSLTILILNQFLTVQCFIDCKNLEFDEKNEVKVYTSLVAFARSDGKSSKISTTSDELTELRTAMIDRKQWYQYYIRKIDLSENRIVTVKAEPFQTIKTCLVVIDLSKNNISDIQRRAFHNLPVLQKLDLSSNQITYIDDDWFNSYNQLRILALDDNQLTTINSDFNLKLLNTLTLSRNNIALSVGMFKNFPNLLILNLEENSITDLPIGTFQGLDSLQQLHLGFNPISEYKMGSLSGLKSLLTLNISHNALTHKSIKSVVNFPLAKLETLIIDGNDGTDLNIAELIVHLPKVQHIGIGNMNWDCKDLIKVYTNCQKYHIDVSTHTDINITQENIHGIQCITKTTTKSPTTTSTSTTSTTTTTTTPSTTISTTYTDSDDVEIIQVDTSTFEAAPEEIEDDNNNTSSDKSNQYSDFSKSEDSSNTHASLIRDVKIIGIILIVFVAVLILLVIFRNKLSLVNRRIRHNVQDFVYRKERKEETGECNETLMDTHIVI